MKVPERLLTSGLNSCDLAAIVDNFAAGISVAGANGRFIYANRRFCEITGYSEEQLMDLDIL